MKKLSFLLLFLTTFLLQAQSAGDVAQIFGTSSGFENTAVNTIAIQSDGKILIGGGFTSYMGATENDIIRLNADGSKDTTFNTGVGFNEIVSSIKIQTDGKILVGGSFTNYKGVIENRIIRLNSDGSKDTSFNTGSGFNISVSKIEIQTNGKILVGGSFGTYNGLTENFIIRLNNDGTKDPTFNVGTGFNNTIATISALANGKILVGGYFTTYKGVAENGIIRLNNDGTKDTTFDTGTGFQKSQFDVSSFVSTIVSQTDGKILVGGNFISYKGNSKNRIIRLNDNGTEDTTFNTGTGFNNAVNEIVIQTDGKILVGGNFTNYNGISKIRIIRLNSEGTEDTTFNTGSSFNASVNTINIQTDGKILVGGGYNIYNEGVENGIIRLNIDGIKDNSLITGTGLNASVNALELQTDGKILVGGGFNSYKGILENRIIRLNTDGTKDTAFNTGTGIGGVVNSIAIQTNGKILVSGGFSTYNGNIKKCIIRLNADGTEDTGFNIGTGFNSSATAMTLQADGKILLGGIFTTYNGISKNRIIRLNSDGTEDTTFNTGIGFNNYVNSITVQTDGKILIGGIFTTYKGVSENCIIRLNNDGTKDTTFNVGTGFNSLVSAIAIQNDKKILIGGNFTTYNGVTENRIIRLNEDGTKDTSFNSDTGFNNAITKITIQPDGKILIGGIFTSYRGITKNRIIRLNTDGTEDTTFNTGVGFNKSVNTLITQADGKILVGGIFTTYKGDNSSAMLIALHSGLGSSLENSKFTNSNTFSVYPNPVQDILNVEMKDLKQIEIFTLFGQKIATSNLSSIKTDNLQSGTYIVTITDISNNSKSVKVIKE